MTPEATPTNVTRAYHIAFDIAPDQFDHALALLHHHRISIAHGPVSRPTGHGVDCYDPDDFMVAIRCDPS